MKTALARLDALVTPERVRAYAAILLVGYLIGAGVLFGGLRHGLDRQGKPPGADFIIFYATSILTLKGHALAAYVPHALLAAERTAVAASRGIFLWTYPPTFQLLVAPLALVPYGVALGVWLIAGLAIYLAAVRKAFGGPGALLPALAFPGVFMNAFQGQTGFLMTALLGGGLLLVETQPWLAGVLFGLLAIKPQFGLLLPLFLALGGKWKTFAAAAVTGILAAGLATFVFGVDAWPAFLTAAQHSNAYLESGALPLYKDPSVFAAFRLWGAPAALAWVAHALQALVAIVLAARAWRGDGPPEIKAGLAVMATLIALPYLFDYDLALLAVPIAVAARRAQGSPTGVRSALALLAICPILIAPLGRFLLVPLGPIALWCGLLALLALTKTETQSAAVPVTA